MDRPNPKLLTLRFLSPVFRGNGISDLMCLGYAFLTVAALLYTDNSSMPSTLFSRSCGASRWSRT